MDRRPCSLSPSQYPPTGGRASGMIRGVTVSTEEDVNARVMDTSPNESATRTRSGWQITPAGESLLTHQDLSAEPQPAGQLVSGGWPARARRADEGPVLHGV